MAQTARQKLVELLKADPTIVAELRELIGDQSQDSDDEAMVEAVFEGTSTEQPTKSQTGKSVKFEIEAPLDGVEDADTKALVVAYLPPEVAADQIMVTVTSVGPKAQPRIIKPRRRKAS